MWIELKGKPAAVNRSAACKTFGQVWIQYVETKTASSVSTETVWQPRILVRPALGVLQPPANESRPLYDPPSNHSESKHKCCYQGILWVGNSWTFFLGATWSGSSVNDFRPWDVRVWFMDSELSWGIKAVWVKAGVLSTQTGKLVDANTQGEC